MIKIPLLAVAAIASLLIVTPASSKESPETEALIEGLLGKLTLEQKLELTYGDGVRFSKPVPAIGLRAMRMHPGPRGHGSVWRLREATAFPSGVGMAASWDPALLEEMGEAIALEHAATGAPILLAPGININRDPLGGRTFEYFTEDPFLNARMTVPYVQGVQKTGVAANLKHYVANNQETNRNAVDARVSERALREIYFPAFEAGVKEGKAWTAMTAANRVNGEYASDSKFLLNDVLKNEWGFDGIIVTDWCETRSGAKAALAGLDMSMPGRPHNAFKTELPGAVQRGEVPESVIDEIVRRILRTAWRTGYLGDRKTPAVPESVILSDKHKALARRAAAEGMVLLKNDGVLPLDLSKIKTIAVFGPNTETIHCAAGKGGSSMVHSPTYEVTPLQGLKNAIAGTDIKILDDPINGRDSVSSFEIITSEFLRTPDGQSGLKAEFFNNADLKGKPALTRVDPEINFIWDMKSPDEEIIRDDNFSARWSGFLVAPESGTYSFMAQMDDGMRISIDGERVLPRFVNQRFREFEFSLPLEAGKKHEILVEYRELDADATAKLSWKRPYGENELKDQLAKVTALAKQADACIFFGGLNNVIETEGHDRKDLNLTPMQKEMMETVIAANPNTAIVMIHGGPVDMRGWSEKAPAILQAWFPGTEAGNAIADIVFGKVNPSGKLPITFPVALDPRNPAHHAEGIPWEVEDYEEGVFVGYRWFDKNKVAPMVPFGHGLSYTTFAYDNLDVAEANEDGKPRVRVSFDLKNTGTRPGREVAQVYVGAPDASVPRPPLELKGFAKVHLAPGESRRVTIDLDDRAFQYWNEKSSAWFLEPGTFEISVGSSSRNLPLKKSIPLGSKTL